MVISVPKSIILKYINEEKGWGVYARKYIKKGSLIERCYCINVSNSTDTTSDELMDYVFNYPKDTPAQQAEHVLPLGYGSIYNHDDNPNAAWRHCELPMVFDFYALKDIKKGEEICTSYGSYYWDFKENRTNGIRDIQIQK
tara:strand:- start:316 stop:738 length:423 start_codon:yes stop_codon:yes gene_type:complete